MEETSPHEPQKKHEDIQTDTRRILLVGMGLLGLMGVGLLVSYGVIRLLDATRDEPRYAGAPSKHVAFQPDELLSGRARIQPNQALELQRQRARNQRVLQSYGWTRPEENVARIPIDEAIRIVSVRGLNPWNAEQRDASQTPEELNDERPPE